MLWVVLGLLVFVLVLCTVVLIKLARLNRPQGNLADLAQLMHTDAKDLRQELGQNLLNFNEAVRKVLEERLETMRATVDEKLQNTLNQRISSSFTQVSERLEQVYKGLGEMQNLALDVGGLKRVLTNVKSRGTWGEVQLGTLLEQILSPDQFIKNAHIKEDGEVVEYAIKLPAGDVLVPIDAKFPIEDYERLLVASDSGDSEAVEKAGNELEKRVRMEAKKIQEKYVYPPKTTDFGILFLPTESLYAEVMKRPGLANDIQNKNRICIAGPSTLGAFLNSLQMGFRTLAIQKKSGEVWQVLSEVKTEFLKYADWVEDVKKKVEQTHKALDAAETRTRAVRRRLEKVETLTASKNNDSLLAETSEQLIKE